MGGGGTKIQTREAGLESVLQPQALPCPHFQRRIHTRSLIRSPPTPGGRTMPMPRIRILGCRAVTGPTQGHRVIRMHKVSNSTGSSNPHHPFHEPKLPPSPSSTQQRRRGGGGGKGGEGKEREGRGGEPPKPAVGSFLVRGKASNEGPADAAELAVSAWEPCGAAGRASLLPISTQVLHQSARLLPGAEARGTALLTVGGGHRSLAGPGPCPLPFWGVGGVQTPNPLTRSHPLQSASSGQTPSPRGHTNEDGRH